MLLGLGEDTRPQVLREVSFCVTRQNPIQGALYAKLGGNGGNHAQVIEGNQFYWVNLKKKVLRKDVVDWSFIHFPRGVFLGYGKAGVSLRFFLQMSVNFIGAPGLA